MMYILDGNYTYNWDETWDYGDSYYHHNGYRHHHKEFSFNNKKIRGGLTFEAKDSTDVAGSSFFNYYSKGIYYNDDGSVQSSSEEHIENKDFFKEGENIKITVELGF